MPLEYQWLRISLANGHDSPNKKIIHCNTCNTCTYEHHDCEIIKKEFEESAFINSDEATKAEAPPPKPLKIATS